MPRPVVLVAHDPAWAARAEGLIAALHAAVPRVFGAVHHMGSTAIPGLPAKPVIDLLAEVEGLEALEGARGALAGLGWRRRGENGLAGRRYFTRDDPETGTRAAQLHVYRAETRRLPGIWPSATACAPSPPRRTPMRRKRPAAPPSTPTTARPMRRANRPRRTGWRRRRWGMGAPDA